MSSENITSTYIKNNLKDGHLILGDSRKIYEKTPYANAFKTALWAENDTVLPNWIMCVKCEEWINAPKSHGTNVLTRHMKRCGFDGHAFLDPENLAKLVANCLRLGGFKVKNEDLTSSFKKYPTITKNVM